MFFCCLYAVSDPDPARLVSVLGLRRLFLRYRNLQMTLSLECLKGDMRHGRYYFPPIFSRPALNVSHSLRAVNLSPILGPSVLDAPK